MVTIMTDIFGAPESFDNLAAVELLGYPSEEGDESKTRELLSSLSDEDRRLHLEWVVYGIEGVIITGEDLVVNYRERLREGATTDIEQSSVIDQLDSRMQWFNFLDRAEEVPLLSPYEPPDGVGSGDVSNLAWQITEGGAKDFAFHKMLEEGIRGLENWKKLTLGRTRLRACSGINGVGGILQRMDKAFYEYSPEEIERRAKEAAEMLSEIFEMMEPGLKEVQAFLEPMGIDLHEIMAQPVDFSQ